MPTMDYGALSYDELRGLKFPHFDVRFLVHKFDSMDKKCISIFFNID